MKIYIEDFSFETIIGILDYERVTKQKVIVYLEAEYNYTNSNYIDYVQLCNTIKDTVINGEFELIEEALLAIKKELIRKFPQIKSFKLKLSKPEILKYAKVSVALNYQLS